MNRFAVALAVGMIASAGCLVDRKSVDFACGPGGTCDQDRVCDFDSGFCVPLVCPEDCDTCDVQARTCSISCSNAGQCNTLECPANFACTIDCVGNNVCDSIVCEEGSSCTITCSGINACQDITCEAGVACTITADETSADSIECSEACRCQVICPAGSCPSDDCPETDEGVECDDPTEVSGCDPGFDATCDRC